MIKEDAKATTVPLTSADPRSSSSLIPMLIGGLALTVVGCLPHWPLADTTK
jgi:hypothetical protein